MPTTPPLSQNPREEHILSDQQESGEHDIALSDNELPQNVRDARTAISNALEQPKQPASLSLFDIPIIFTSTGEKKSITHTPSTAIQINVKHYGNTDEARRAGMLAATHLSALRDSLAADTQVTLDVLKDSDTDAQHLNTAVLLRGLKKMRDSEPQAAGQLSQMKPTSLTLSQQFDYACEQYLLRGVMPEGLSEEVREALKNLNKNGKNALDIITQEDRTLKSSVALYGKYIATARKTLTKKDASAKETERDDYVPPPFSGEMEPLDPESVQFRVEPFLGGYYRGQIFRYDPAQGKLVADPSPCTVWNPPELPENIDDLKKYIFHGKYLPGKECILPLPEQAFPLPLTLSSPDFQLLRNRRGTFILEPKNPDAYPSHQEPTNFSFTFVLAKTEENRIDDEPEESDLATLAGALPEEVASFIETLAQNTFTSEKDRARSVVSRTRQQLMYPEEDQVSEMNARYTQSGDTLMQAIYDHTIADCHWSNIYAGEQGRRLDIPWRTPTGFFVQKIPGIDFAAIGGIGHAWSEVWIRDDSGRKKWERMDATPPRQQDEEEKDKEPQDRDVEEDNALTLSEEELTALLEEIRKEQPLDGKLSEDEIARALFLERTKINPHDWKKVKQFIDAMNAKQIPSAMQISEKLFPADLFRDRITAPRGTLEREWQKLFCLIYKHRQVAERAFRGPVRQSEGTSERDTTDIYIDVMSGETDPMGYNIESKRMRTYTDITEFEEDSIVDLTSSMNTADNCGNNMRVEQKKLILSMLYQIMCLNEKLNDSRVKNNMREPVQIRSEIYSIHGNGRNSDGNYAQLKSRNDDITEQALIYLNNVLDKTTAGAGDLVSALRKYRTSITPEVLMKIKKGKFVKMITLYSDGNTWCAACGQESCNTQMHRVKVHEARQEVKMLREMGIIVQGIGFTQAGSSIKLICEDPSDPQAAVVVDDSSKAIFARQQMLRKHLQKL
jgi:hypothetical protein